MKTADDVSKAYHEGYEQGRFDAIADIPHGIEKGYSVVAVVRCGECRYRELAKVNCKGFTICPASGMEITDDDFCSYGERKEETE